MMNKIRTMAVAVGFAATCGAGLIAQTQETRTTTNTKVEIKGGKDVTLIGCLERSLTGAYILADVREPARHEPTRYALVSKEDLAGHVGERVEIKGKAVVDGNGKVSLETTTKTEVENGKDQESKMKSEGTAGALDMPSLGVKSMKTLSSHCYE
jgi:hypothetical protein